MKGCRGEVALLITAGILITAIVLSFCRGRFEEKRLDQGFQERLAKSWENCVENCLDQEPKAIR